MNRYRITIEGRYFTPRISNVKAVAALAFSMSKIDEQVTIEDSDGYMVASFVKRSTGS